VSTSHDTPKGADRASAGAAPPPKVRKTYPQDWHAYNAAQTREKEMVAALLGDLCTAIESPPQKRGRPRIPLADAVFAATMKVYGTTSGRRAMTDMRAYEASGFVAKAPSYNSTFDYLENPVLTPILQNMIEESARPLRSIESEFAVDSSGFSTAVYRRWYDHKYGREQAEHVYVKAHVMVGVKTNVVTSVEVTPSSGSDYPVLPHLLKATAGNFNVAKLSADKAYSGRSNIEAIHTAGALPLIPFRSNAKAKMPGLWREAFEFFRDHADDFYRQYHQRSNVETTFSMIKAKFGGFVRSKTPTAQVNEVLCKVLAHNLCCLVQSFFEFGIEPAGFWQKGASPVAARATLPTPYLPPRTPWRVPSVDPQAPRLPLEG